MEISYDSSKTSQHIPKRKGGLITVPFIIANEAFERVASFGLVVNMILYLKGEYHFDNATGASILFWWGALSNFMPVFGAFLSDSYLGRFSVIALGTLVSLTGQSVLWLTAVLPQARPPFCEHYPENCVKPNAGNLLVLFSALALMSIGAGGIRPCSLAFGADQLDDPGNPKNERALQSFFNWYYASVATSMAAAVIVIVYIQTRFGWGLGFGIPVVFMFFSTVMFFSGSKLYVKIKPSKSLLTGFAQVIVVAWKNRHLALPPTHSEGWYHRNRNSEFVSPTEKLRFLNKACIVRNPSEELNLDGSISDPWKACTVKQVEYFKALIKVLPIWSTGIMAAVIITQQSFALLQATTMDRHIVGNFKIPPATLSVFGILTLSIWVAVYDRLIVPQLAKYTKNPRGLSFEQRMGIGLFLSCIATGVAGLVERRRRGMAIDEGLAAHPLALVKMSAFWLVPQHCLVGLAEAFNAIGQIEFYYSHFPKSMASIGVSLFLLGMGFGNMAGGLIVMIVNRVSARGGKESWVGNNLNLGHYDYYYWILCILSSINFFYFVLLNSFGYAYGDEQMINDDEVEDEIKHSTGETNSYRSHQHMDCRSPKVDALISF